MNAPLCFESFLRPMVWGGRRLAHTLGKTLPTSESYGEAWEISDHELHRSVVASGPWAGRDLRELMKEERQPLLGPAADRFQQFPWLIKFLDARDWLSVQVHPDDQAVKQLWPGEGGKTEVWFVLAAAPGSRIYAGLQPGVDADKLRAALKNGTIVDCLHSFSPTAGDCIFLPAGTVHAVGGGVLLAEVQQTSDATFRLFDWNRVDAQGKSRQLHVEQALSCIDWNRGKVFPIQISRFAARNQESHRQPLVGCRYFELEYVQTTEPLALGGKNRLQAAIVIGGKGTWADSGVELNVGQTWLLPAQAPVLECWPDAVLKLLVCSLP
ncbi:MAG: type I phosphomannose isomerase catalytic subunit [Gemmataceae bacterium]